MYTYVLYDSVSKYTKTKQREYKSKKDRSVRSLNYEIVENVAPKGKVRDGKGRKLTLHGGGARHRTC